MTQLWKSIGYSQLPEPAHCGGVSKPPPIYFSLSLFFPSRPLSVILSLAKSTMSAHTHNPVLLSEDPH